MIRRPADSIATRGWFIGMMLAIAFLLLILIIVCIVKRNRGGKYAVHEREAAHGRTDFNEEQGFPEFAQPYVRYLPFYFFITRLVIHIFIISVGYIKYIQHKISFAHILDLSSVMK